VNHPTSPLAPTLAPGPGSRASDVRASAPGRFARRARRLGAWLGGLLFLLLFWGVAVEPYQIDERHETAVLPGLPAEWEGREVVVIADFQIGMWAANTGTIERIVRRLVERRPAAVLIAGDFAYKADDRVDKVADRIAELVRPLAAAGIPTIAVLGNHDYSMNWESDPVNPRVAEAVRSALRRSGVHVLENEAVALRRGGGAPLYVVGIGSEWAGRARPAEAVARVPSGAARIVFMHNPRSFAALPAGTAPLAVAAHTHGGQVSLPFTPHWSWMSLVKDEIVEVDGWAQRHEGDPGNRLYVNVGIGFSDAPVRINAPPELTIFRLRRAADAGARSR
jgi:predicted MPP superfamily phosphohydrolase